MNDDIHSFLILFSFSAHPKWERCGDGCERDTQLTAQRKGIKTCSYLSLLYTRWCFGTRAHVFSVRASFDTSSFISYFSFRLGPQRLCVREYGSGCRRTDTIECVQYVFERQTDERETASQTRHPMIGWWWWCSAKEFLWPQTLNHFAWNEMFFAFASLARAHFQVAARWCSKEGEVQIVRLSSFCVKQFYLENW